jgi:hypothetical protein
MFSASREYQTSLGPPRGTDVRGPLSPADAKLLIREPIETLGMSSRETRFRASENPLLHEQPHCLVQFFHERTGGKVNSFAVRKGPGAIPQLITTRDIDSRIPSRVPERGDTKGRADLSWTRGIS